MVCLKFEYRDVEFAPFEWFALIHQTANKDFWYISCLWLLFFFLSLSLSLSRSPANNCTCTEKNTTTLPTKQSIKWINEWSMYIGMVGTRHAHLPTILGRIHLSRWTLFIHMKSLNLCITGSLAAIVFSFSSLEFCIYYNARSGSFDEWPATVRCWHKL